MNAVIQSIVVFRIARLPSMTGAGFGFSLGQGVESGMAVACSTQNTSKLKRSGLG